MLPLPSDEAGVPPVLVAALLLAANTHLDRLDLPHPTAARVLDATGAGRTQAYDLSRRILAFLPTLLRPPGRPAAPPPPAVDTGAISREVLAFLGTHPGARITGDTRHTYSDGFRHFILDLAARHADLDRARLAEAVGVPVDTLKDWLDAPPPAPIPKVPVDDDVANERIAAIAEA